ncbi:hypothetical protein SAMN05216552_100852 [Pseudoduganella namucuonensis]|uniref:Uncharacterized protein n=2 Tax=Pseudoduganella namucuonensis TaxID=1035707 RepID=A0A1I7II20_9BURK|nr:hypothetical protein SAMN05216552_100852 [Pseudoduganella namucuonensis]
MQELAAAAGSEEERRQISADVPHRMENLLSKYPSEMLAGLKVNAERGLAERRKLHAEFVDRNTSRWKEGFDLLELQIEISIEAGDSFTRRLRPKATAEGDLVFDLLVRLQAKGILVAKEILTLLKNGYADGAHGRWRSLHEMTVTAMFMLAHGQEAARRYLDHESVDAYRAALQLEKFVSRLNTPGFSEGELAQLKARYDAVLDAYGKDFANAYGWARPFLGKGNPNFLSMEEAVGLDHLRPYYMWASQNVHASAKTIKTSLGLSETVSEALQVGPSNSGMTDPAHSTAISLSQLTITLLRLAPNLDDSVMMKVLLLLTDEIGQAFVRCSENPIA